MKSNDKCESQSAINGRMSVEASVPIIVTSGIKLDDVDLDPADSAWPLKNTNMSFEGDDDETESASEGNAPEQWESSRWFRVMHTAGLLNIRATHEVSGPILRQLRNNDEVELSEETIYSDPTRPGTTDRRMRLASGEGWLTHSIANNVDGSETRVFLTEIPAPHRYTINVLKDEDRNWLAVTSNCASPNLTSKSSVGQPFVGSVAYSHSFCKGIEIAAVVGSMERLSVTLVLSCMRIIITVLCDADPVDDSLSETADETKSSAEKETEINFANVPSDSAFNGTSKATIGISQYTEELVLLCREVLRTIASSEHFRCLLVPFFFRPVLVRAGRDPHIQVNIELTLLF